MAKAMQLIPYLCARHAARLGAPLARRWHPYSRLLMVRDYAGWSLDVDAKVLTGICKKIGVKTIAGAWMDFASRQAVFHVDQFVLLNPPDWRQHRVGIAYYHGIPGSGLPEFDEVYDNLCRCHERISRIQVSHSEMRDVILESGIAPEKVFTIPIGVHAGWFRPPTDVQRLKLRANLGFPDHAVVVGSFQKDGVGWGEGLEPKLIKGPDVFLDTMKALHAHIPDLHVLLTGPSRGFIKKGLEALHIPYKHVLLKTYRETAAMYHALDAYMVTSRQEGGPKAVLESMATGVPLISTRVGQAMDIVEHEKNGCLVDVGDVDALAYWTEKALTDAVFRQTLRDNGLKTAHVNSYDAQQPLWKAFMDGFVTRC